jgi:hypothetical protein
MREELNDWDLCRGVDIDRSLRGTSNSKRVFVRDSTCIDICLQGTWQFMSTRQLTNPGSRHTITDDLESHYFVLMWTALHWVKHNEPHRPCIDMENIFDQQRPMPDCDDIVEGGAGKTGCIKRGILSFAKSNLHASRSMSYSGVCGSFFARTSHRNGALTLKEGDPGE